jgi:hypothetical protein
MQTVNFEIVQGDTFILNVTYKDPNGVPIDLTSFDGTFEVRDQQGGQVLCTLASINGGEIVVDNAGHLTITIVSTETKKFTVPKAYYQLKLDSGSVKTTILAGWFAVERSIS